VKEAALTALKALLPRGQVFTDRTSLITYEADGGMDKGMPEGVVFPCDAEEVSRLVRWAAEHHVPLVARGAGTGLSGGAVPDRGGVIVEFERMNRILDIDTQGRSAVVEPALINLRLDERVKPLGLYFPPDPASQRASTIGGNVAENAGGPHCFKYGVTTNYITGLQVVLANGERIRVGGRALDYPEYDLCGLITGSEGMLCLITATTVRLLRNPPGVKTMLAIFDSLEQAGNAVSAVIASGLVPATMEMMEQRITSIIEPFAHAGLPLDADAILLIEVDGYPESLDAQIEEIVHILRAHGGHDFRIAGNEDERARIWLARKSAGGAVARLSPAYVTIDITVPRSRLTDALLEVNRICEHNELTVGQLMHAGDGNLHPMILVPEPENRDLRERVHHAGAEIVKMSVEMGGSLSGEHGVGIEKREFMSLMHTPDELMAMWDVKQAFDPDNLFNPGKIFPTPARDETGPFAGYALRSASAAAHNEPVPNGETFAPATAEEAAEGLLALAKAGKRVYIGNAWSEASHPREGVIRLCTEALRGIKMYAPDDLYITVGAGTPLAEIHEFLSARNKRLALAWPWPESTIGGLVSANINAPQRMRFGAIRDLALCATAALPDGRVIRTGRPIVKNVAGYDLTKAFIGSYGTLSLLTDITLKLTVPRAWRTLLVPVDDLRYGLILARKLLPLALTASAIVLCKGYQAVDVPRSNYLLAYTAEGILEDVLAELDQVEQALREAGAPEPTMVEYPTGTDIWADLLRRNDGLQVRAALPVRDLPAYVQDHAAELNEGPFIVDIGSGFVYAIKQNAAPDEARAWLETLRQPALADGGYAVALMVPEALRGKIDRWGYQPEGLPIMKRLKALWDPQGILNPGVFVVDR
jgi:glycolate oxidase subunit GlcD